MPVKSCGAPPSIADGMSQVSGSTATYTCNAGFVRKTGTRSVITCSSNRWMYSIPPACGTLNFKFKPIKSLTHPLNNSLTHKLTHSHTHSFTNSPLTHTFTNSSTHKLTRSLTHTLTHTLTHSPAHFWVQITVVFR